MKRVEILVVEDEAIVAADLAARLRRLGYRVPAVVPSGEEALERIPTTSPGLILMDIKLAGELDGIEAARQIHSQFDIPVIYVTAHSDDATLERAKATGPYGYLIKPFDSDELRTAIEVGLYKHEIDSRLKESERRLRQAHDEMEMRVRERTAELAQANVALHAEIRQRRRLEKSLLTISEQEQLRIGQDLHDGLGQQLTGIAFLGKALAQKLQQLGLPEAADAGRQADLLNEVISQTRELARGLHPVEAEPGGLMTALGRWAEHIASVFGLPCCFECPEPVLIADNEMATQLYRIAQEATHNAVKHARASRMVIGLRSTDGHIELAVQDNGGGFAQDLDAAPGMGLQIMRHRAEAIGAALGIDSSPRDGTRVTCSVPIGSGSPLAETSAPAGRAKTPPGSPPTTSAP